MDLSSIRMRMQPVLELVQSDIASIRTGRVTSALVENVEVAVYGGAQRLKIKELATITASDLQTLIISPWDKSIIGEINKGILAANLGFNPTLSSQGGSASGGDGEVIRISLPPLTTEDRGKYVKLLFGKLENGRVMIRQIRGDGMHEIKKAFEEKRFGEDEKFRLEKELQAITDEFIGKIDETGERKKSELLQI